MRNILLLILTLSVLFVTGCGSGGGGSTASTTSPGGGTTAPNVGQSGNFTLSLHDAAATASVDLRHSLAIDTANMVRVVIRKIATSTITVDVCPGANYDDNGQCNVDLVPTQEQVTTEVYRKIQDVGITTVNGNKQVSIVAPVGDTYTFDVLTYLSGPPNEMLKFGTGSITVTDGGQASITINDIVASLVVVIPSPMISDEKYPVNFGAPNTPVRGYYEMGVWVPSTKNTPTLVKITGGSIVVTAPHTTNQGDTTVSFDCKYFISDNMLNTGEKFADWTRINTLSSTFVPLATMTVPVS